MSTVILARAVQTGEAAPSQWDAWDAEGSYWYLRYRSGRGTAERQPSPDEWTWTVHEPEIAFANDGTLADAWISLDDFCRYAGIVITGCKSRENTALPSAPFFSPDQLLGARFDAPDQTGKITGWEPLGNEDAVSAPDALNTMSYLFAGTPPAGYAMARLEIVTPGGTIGLSMPDITVGHRDGRYVASAVSAGLTWSGEADTLRGAVIALLADRAGYKADVTLKEDA